MSEKPLRKDAERNRRKVLEAARRVYAERGLDVTLDDIAAAAGVGVGTVYRRFADKDELIDVLFQERMDEIAELAQAQFEVEDPWEALTGFLEGALEMQVADRGLKDLVLGSERGREGIAAARARISPHVMKLVERAKAAGAIRADVVTPDMPMIQLMVGSIIDATRDAETDVWRRYLWLVLAGMRSGIAEPEPLPVPGMSFDEFEATVRGWRPSRR